MKALTFSGIQQLNYETVPDPQIAGPSDVIVRILRAGICGSDLHIYHGRETGLDIGTVMGHEFAGEIVETGANVKKFRAGDPVCSPFTVNCGDCFFCQRGLTARCVAGNAFFGWVENGEGLHGAQAEYVRVPMADSTLVAIPAALSLEEAILLGDNFSTGFFCADMAEVKPGGVYVIIGCGVVGLMSVLAARERGAEKLIAVDKLAYRLQMAKSMGASHIATPEAAGEIVRNLSDGRGADAILEAVGSPQAHELAIELIRPGGILAVVGMHTEPQFVFSPTEAYNLNLTYKTGRCSARYYMERVLPSLEKNRDKIADVITHRLPLSAGVEGYRLFDNKAKNCLKVILQPSPSASSSS